MCTSCMVILVTQRVKNPPALQETQVQLWEGTITSRMKWLPTPVFLPGEFHGQRSLAGYSTRAQRETGQSDLHFHFSHLLCTGEIAQKTE